MDVRSLICNVEMEIMGLRCHVEVYAQRNGKCFAFTRFSAHDAIISDGANLKDALQRHATALPFAVNCRRRVLGLPAEGTTTDQ